jgi:hypothetical protein
LGEPEVDLTYPYAVTMDEVLEIVIEHIDEVRNTEDMVRQGAHLKMASRALRCALEIYGLQLKVPNEEVK